MAMETNILGLIATALFVIIPVSYAPAPHLMRTSPSPPQPVLTAAPHERGEKPHGEAAGGGGWWLTCLGSAAHLWCTLCGMRIRHFFPA